VDRINCQKVGIRVTSDLIHFLQSSIEGELINRTTEFSTPGIIDPDNPSVPQLESPFYVEPNPSLTGVIVHSGTVLFENGNLHSFETTEVTFPSTKADHFLVAKFVEEEQDDQLSDYNEIIKTRIVGTGEIETVPIGSYVQETNEEVIAVLAYIASDDSWTIEFSGSYTVSIRRWATPVDITHRSDLGTGEQTPSNPHAISFNDLTLKNDLRFWDLITGDGIVVGNMERHFHGKRVADTIPSTQFESVGALKQATLSYFPNSFIETSESGVEKYSAFAPSQKQVQFFHAGGSNIIFEYTTVYAGQVKPIPGTTTEFEVLAPVEKEVVISEGAAVDLTQQIHSTKEFVHFPLDMGVIVNSTGTTRLTPSLATEVALLSDFQVPEGISVNVELPFPSKLIIGIAETNSFTANVVVTLSGTDASGTNISETVILNDSSAWTEAPTSHVGYFPDQYVEGTNTFKTLTKIRVDSISGTGGPSINTILAVFNEEVSPPGLRLATIKTSRGSGIASLQDDRPIISALQQKFHNDQDTILFDCTTNPMLGGNGCEWDPESTSLIRGIYQTRPLIVQSVGSAPYIVLNTDQEFRSPTDVEVLISIGSTEYTCTPETSLTDACPQVAARVQNRRWTLPSEAILHMNANEVFHIRITTLTTRIPFWALVAG